MIVKTGDHAMNGRLAVVIGGTGGIGRAICARLAEAGANVVAVGRSDRPERMAGIEYRSADILDYDGCRALVADILAEEARIDALVNCTNLPVSGMGGAFADVDPYTFNRFLSASLTTMFNIVHASLPAMAAHGGSIVMLASDSGKVAAPNQAMIGSTRAAIMMFCRSLALEVAATGVRVNCLSTSFVRDTPVFDDVMAGAAASRARTARRRAAPVWVCPGPITSPHSRFSCAARFRRI